MGVTRTLAHYAVNTTYEDLPEEVVQQVKVCTLNILGVVFGGYKTRIGQLHVKMAKDFGGGRPQATIIGDGAKVSCPLAAYANGSLGFALDYEDMIHYILHPGYISVAAGLAIGEKVKASGKDFITAITLAYEVGSRIALSMQPTPERGGKVWGEQYTPFCSVVPAGKLLGLDEDRMDIAFGITGTYATVPSAYKYFGIVNDTRPMKEVKLGWGWMCMAGVFGALSAKEGFRGGYGILDGEEGFWIMEGSDRCDFGKMTEGLGTKYYTLEAEFKVHPSIGWVHPVYVAIKQLVEEHDIKPGDIEQVLVRGMQTNRVDDYDPAGPVDAMFSLPYTVATTILREKLLPDMYSDEKIKSPEVQSLLKKIKCEQDPEADQLWFDNQWLVFSIEMTLKGRKQIKRRVEWPKEKPPFGKEEVEKKFRDLASLVVPARQVEEIIHCVDNLESLDNISKLTALLHE
jgi:2-methylcitrate dehydratase PrpD